jgi:anaerobic magnesium-protoporphyrin IX monomethyl ester cyclase
METVRQKILLEWADNPPGASGLQLSNDGLIRKTCATRDLLLDRGIYRFSVHYRIQANPHQDVNLMEMRIVESTGPLLLKSLLLPKKIRPETDSPWMHAQMDVCISEAKALQFEVSLNNAGRIELSQTSVEERRRDLPTAPQVLFVNPDHGFTDERIVHQGISSIGAYLEKNGIQSHALLTSSSSEDDMAQAISRYRYPYVGFHIVSYDPCLAVVRKLTQRVRELHPEVVLLAGGPHATLAADRLFREIPEIDIAVQGEGEATCLEIISGKPWNEIAGIVYRNGDSLATNPPRGNFKNLEVLPSPRRDIYLQADWNAHSLSTSRGCPHRCHFCIGGRIFGPATRFRPLHQIEEELAWLYENGDHSLVVSINDDMFNLWKERTLKLMEIFKRFPFVYFPRGMRADRLDDEVVRAMRDAGVVGTSIGIEAADNGALRAMGKGETLEQIESGIQHLRRYGIGIVAMFMIGNVGDTLESIQKTIEFSQRYQFEDLNISCAIPFPGTPLEEYVTANHLWLKNPITVYPDATNGSTTIYFETPQFPLADRIKAVELVYQAGMLRRRAGSAS